MWLVSQGIECVDVNAATSTGLTAASEAAKVGHWDIVRHLENCGARYIPGRDQVILRERRALQEVPESQSQPSQRGHKHKPLKKRPLQVGVVERNSLDRIKRKNYSDVAMNTDEKMQEQVEDKENMCVVCMELPSKTAMVPCGHASFCEECANRLKSDEGRCAVCRTNIQTVMNIYFS